MQRVLGAVLLWALSLVAAAGQEPLTLTLTAPAQPQPSIAGAWIDFAGLLARAGVKAPFDPASVRVELGGAAPVAVPARITAGEGAQLLRWLVPAAATPALVGQPLSVKVSFGSRPTPTTSAELPAEALETLVANGGFEQAANGVPNGLAAATFARDFRYETEGDNHYLAYNHDPEGHGPLFQTPWVAVQPGIAYVYTFRYRAREAEAHPRYKLIGFGYVNYRDAAGQRLPRVGVFNTREGNSDGWQTFRAVLAAPAGAAGASLEIRNGSKTPYAFAIDEVRIAPAANPVVLAAETADGRRISLRAEDPRIRRFDLGPASSPLWEGYTALTPESSYSAERGWGFTRLDQPAAADKTRPEPLARDFITALRADLRVDLPDGAYTAWLLVGDSQVGSTVEYYYRDQRLAVNETEVLKRDFVPSDYFQKEHFRHYHDFWRPGMDYYQTFVAPRFEELSFPAQVSGGKLALSWRHLPVAALVIYPNEAAAEARSELERLPAERRRATTIEEVPGPAEDEPAPTSAERSRGYVIFRRPANEEVFPSSRPAADERLDTLRLFAAQGQAQTANFSLYPLRDLGNVSVRATDLRSGANRLPASAIEIRVVRPIFKAVGGSSAAYRYRVTPALLDRRDAVPVSAGTSWSWWSIIRVPEGCAAGVYEGALEITPEQGEPLRLPLAVRVLPLELAPLPIWEGYYYFPSEPWYSAFWGANVRGPQYRDDPAVRALIEANERREMRFVKDLGLNSLCFSDDLRRDLAYVDGKVQYKPDNRFVFWMDIYRDERMGPMPFYGFQPIGAGNLLAWLDRPTLTERFTPAWNTAYRSFVTEGQRLAKERSWPEILWYISDELSNHGEEGAKLGVQLAQTLKDLEGVRTIASMNGPWEHIMVPHLDLSMPNIAFPVTAETVKMVRDAGSELWLYNCGEERLNMGLYPWRVGAGGRYQWHYRSMDANPWDDLDGNGSDTQYAISLPGPDGPVPAIRAEIVREAVTDHRYLATLEQAVAAARTEPAKAELVAQAERFLADLRARIPVDVRTLVGYQVDPRAAGASLGGEFKNTDALDRVRWAAADLIMKLQGSAR